MTAAQRRSSATMRLAMTSLSAMDSAMLRFTFFLLCVSDALTKIATSEKVSRTLSALSSPLLLGTSTISDTCSGTSMPRSTSTPSDSCGMTSGRTKLATSMRLQAGPGQPVDQVDLVGRGDGFRFVLESVARADLADIDMRRQSAHSVLLSRSS